MKRKSKINPGYLEGMEEIGLGNRAKKLHNMWSEINGRFLDKHQLKIGSVIKIEFSGYDSHKGVSWREIREVELLEKPTLENHLIVNTSGGKVNAYNLKEVVKY